MMHKLEVIIETIHDPWTWYFAIGFVICAVVYICGGRSEK